MTRNSECHSKSNSFVVSAEQVRLEPVLEHRQRRSWCHIAWQAVPHLCTSNRKSPTSDCWPTEVGTSSRSVEANFKIFLKFSNI